MHLHTSPQQTECLQTGLQQKHDPSPASHQESSELIQFKEIKMDAMWDPLLMHLV